MTNDRPTNDEDVAYYYPAPFWRTSEGGWVKSLLLFFDRVAILLPDYMHGRQHLEDPTLSLPLEERGLLTVLEPTEWIDSEVTEQLTTVLVELITSGAFDELQESSHFTELSQSRMGYGADVGLAEMVVDELKAKGLARASEDGVSIPLHPAVRTTILVTLAQLARNAGVRRGLRLHPATSNENAVIDLIRSLSLPPLPSAGHVVALDLDAVTLNLDPVSLDDVLDFRAEHADQHKTYMRDLQRVAAELALANVGERDQLMVERREELAEAANDLRRIARRAFKKRLGSWSLGLAGGAWAIAAKDPLGVALAAASQLLDLLPTQQHASAYSFLFSAQSELSRQV